jgi:hypothetical protein
MMIAKAVAFVSLDENASQQHRYLKISIAFGVLNKGKSRPLHSFRSGFPSAIKPAAFS